VSPKGWINQLPNLDPGIVGLRFRGDKGEGDSAVIDGGNDLKIVVINGDANEHQSLRARGGVGNSEAGCCCGAG